MALTKEPFLLQDSQSTFAYRPLALSPWRHVFDMHGNLAPGLEDDKYSSRDLATYVAEQSVKVCTSLDHDLARTALFALDSTIADQAGRNARYNTSAMRGRLAERYSEDAEDILYGVTSPARLVQTVIENDDLVTSLEVARYTHVDEWKLVHNINEDVPNELLGSDFDAATLDDAPKYKIKGFYERAILAERKRHIMSFMGGSAILVMRLNFLIDCKSPDLPVEIAHHIQQERGKLHAREQKGYNFDAENELLRDALDNQYVRASNAVNFIVPVQTGHYVYSPSAHEREKQEEVAKKAEQERKARELRAFFQALDT